MEEFEHVKRPIPQKQFPPIPREWFKTDKRKVAHEEVCRDLEKSPEQILVDIHDESLDQNRSSDETISRSIARLASLQVRTQRELEKQSQGLNRLNKWVGALTIIVSAISIWQFCRSFSPVPTPKSEPTVIQLSPEVVNKLLPSPTPTPSPVLSPKQEVMPKEPQKKVPVKPGKS
jgi:hypothetical protein